jgi:hypothetical protein
MILSSSVVPLRPLAEIIRARPSARGWHSTASFAGKKTAAAPTAHVFFLLGTLVMLPIILGHMIFVYWVFSGKLREGEVHH